MSTFNQNIKDSQLIQTLETSPVAMDPPFSLFDEYLFWTHQMAEHSLFIALGLSDQALDEIDAYTFKQQALDFYQSGMKMLLDFDINKGVNYKNIFDYLDKLEAYLTSLLELVSETWVGFVYPSLVTHYIIELKYFRRKLLEFRDGERIIPPDEELKFWQKLAGDHAAVIARLLDPNPRQLQLYKDINQFSEYFSKLTESDINGELFEFDNLVMLTIQNNDKLNEYFRKIQLGISNSELLSVIHPALIAHIIREGERAKLALESNE